MNVESLFQRAKQAETQGDYDHAEQLYLELLKKGFQPEAMLNAVVNVCFLSNSFARAAMYLSQLCSLCPTKIAYCEALANLFARAQNWQAAANSYAVFIDHNPTHADAYFNYAYNLKLAHKYQDAIDNYQVALEHRVSKPEEVLTNIAVIYSENLRLESKAIESLERALELEPDYIPAIFNLATLLEEVGSKDRATKYYKKILKLDSTHYSALIRLAEAQQITDSNAPIIGQMQDVLNGSSVDVETRVGLNFALGKLLDGSGRYEDSFNFYAAGNRLDREATPKYDRTKQEKIISDNICFFTKEWFSGLASISDAQPIFICGMFRSGSTLVEQILASHSMITAGGERNFFIRTGSEVIQPYPQALDKFGDVDLQALAEEYLQELAISFPNAKQITDKRPDNFLYLGLIKTLFPKARIIHTQRNRLDNCLSVYFLRAGASVSYATDLSDIAHYYQQYSSLMAHWKSAFAGDIYEVSYDQLVAEPEPVVKALLDRLELPWESQCLEFHSLDNRVKTASIWQVRERFYKTSSGRWKNHQANIKDLLDAFEQRP